MSWLEVWAFIHVMGAFFVVALVLFVAIIYAVASEYNSKMNRKRRKK